MKHQHDHSMIMLLIVYNTSVVKSRTLSSLEYFIKINHNIMDNNNYGETKPVVGNLPN